MPIAPVCRENPHIQSDNATRSDHGPLFRVIIIDNDYNTYEEVIQICMLALGISVEDAYRIALAVDHNGEAEVLQAPREEAERIAAIIRTIGIEVRVVAMGDSAG